MKLVTEDDKGDEGHVSQENISRRVAGLIFLHHHLTQRSSIQQGRKKWAGVIS
jgi:hypothetical protein